MEDGGGCWRPDSGKVIVVDGCRLMEVEGGRCRLVGMRTRRPHIGAVRKREVADGRGGIAGLGRLSRVRA